MRHRALPTAAKCKSAQDFAHVAAAKIVFKDVIIMLSYHDSLALVTHVYQCSSSFVCSHITFTFHLACKDSSEESMFVV